MTLEENNQNSPKARAPGDPKLPLPLPLPLLRTHKAPILTWAIQHHPGRHLS